MAGILDSAGGVDDTLRAGILQLLTGGRQTNGWEAAGQALSGAASGYMSALADPRTRGMALGAGALGAGQGFAQSGYGSGGILGGATNSKDRLAQLVQLSQLAKNLKDPNTAPSELQKLIAAKNNMDPKSPDYKSVNDRIAYLSGGESRPQTSALERAVAARDALPQGDPRRAIYDNYINKETHFAPQQQQNFSPQITVNPVDLPGAFEQLQKNQAGTQQGAELTLEDTLSQLNSAIGLYDDSYGRIGGKLAQTTRSWRDYAADIPVIGGMVALSPTEKQDTEQMAMAMSALGEFSAGKIHALYGAALTSGEAARADLFIPSASDSPTVAVAKMKIQKAVLEAAIARKKVALTAGVPADIKDPGQLEKAAGSIADFIQDPRAKALFLGKGAGEAPPAAAAAAGAPPPVDAGAPPPAAPAAGVPAQLGSPSPAGPGGPGLPPAPAVPAAPSPASAPVTLPPLQQRVVNQVYPTPKGPMRWTGTGWLPAS